MGDESTSFAARPYSAAFNLGLPTGAGVRLGANLGTPIVAAEAHAGTALLFQDYGADLVVRPLAGRYNVTPTVRLGMAAMQNNLAGLGGPPWLPMPSAGVGVEWRARNGFLIGGDVGVSLPITPGTSETVPTTVKVAPNVNFTIGYAFHL